jgi:23S rRNA pseudouridine1911/1915/1917 synthase
VTSPPPPPLLPVLCLTKGYVVIDKPAGLPVEADSRESVLALLARQLAPKGGGRAWPRVVHRLDRDTSGCLLVALNDAAAKALLAAFEDGQVRKEYVALVAGEPPAEGALDTAYGKDPGDGRRYTTRIDTPRRARLRYAVAERLRGAALLRVWLETGRTHQIRVQLSEMGHPVIGDGVYGASTAELARASGLSRQALHAARLSFPDPGGAPAAAEADPSRIECLAPLPEDLLRAVQALR